MVLVEFLNFNLLHEQKTTDHLELILNIIWKNYEI